MSNDHVWYVKVEVQTKDGRTVGEDAPIHDRESLRRELSRMATNIEAELDERGLFDE